ncbi:MAG: hypothetical protein U1F47_07430 [Hyphomicrobiales bacterium]
MISETTLAQLARLDLTGRPLLICDVDEVVVHFTREFEDFLAERRLWLDTSSFALNGNVRHRDGNAPVEAGRVAELIDVFFAERTLHMSPIDGAVESLIEIGQVADVVLLTNLPHSAGEDRRRNLERHGLPFPVVTNSGPKGPAIRQLAQMTRAPSVFVDDSPSFIASAYEHAPEVHLVHFLHDERFARHIEPFDFLSLRTGSWDEARPHIAGLIGLRSQA